MENKKELFVKYLDLLNKEELIEIQNIVQYKLTIVDDKKEFLDLLYDLHQKYPQFTVFINGICFKGTDECRGECKSISWQEVLGVPHFIESLWEFRNKCDNGKEFINSFETKENFINSIINQYFDDDVILTEKNNRRHRKCYIKFYTL